MGVGGKVFVRIQHENPVVAGFSKELLADTVHPGNDRRGKDALRVLCGDGSRGVGALHVDHDDVIGPGHRIEGFVEGFG